MVVNVPNFSGKNRDKTGWTGMKFGKRYSKVTVFMAMLHGVIIGVAAVAVIGFILVGTGGKNTVDKVVEEIPASGPASTEAGGTKANGAEPLKLFAKQHGMFTTPAAAAKFMTEDPSLATAAIIQSGEQYFVWSAVGLTEAEISEGDEEGTFSKKFVADASMCEVVNAKKLQSVFAATELAKIKSSDSEKGDEKTEDLERNIASITAFTDDLRVIRLHLLSHYSYTKDCVKISF